jgi:hypothetical protein
MAENTTQEENALGKTIGKLPLNALFNHVAVRFLPQIGISKKPAVKHSSCFLLSTYRFVCVLKNLTY